MSVPVDVPDTMPTAWQMKEPLGLLHPEIDLYHESVFNNVEAAASHRTDIDILELGPHPQEAVGAKYRQNLDDKSISAFLNEKRAQAQERVPVLTVFFININRQGIANHFPGHNPMAISAKTLKTLQEHFQLCPQFILWLVDPFLYNEPRINSLSRRNEDGDLLTLEGFYAYNAGKSPRTTLVYYLHDTKRRASTYFLVDYSNKIKDYILLHATGATPQILLRLGAIDTFIASTELQREHIEGMPTWDKVVRLEKQVHISANTGRNRHHSFHMTQKNQIFEMHGVASSLSSLICANNELENRFLHIQGVHDSLYHYFGPKRSDPPGICAEHSISDSLKRLITGIQERKMWLENFHSRVQTHIDLHYHLRAQEDNQINLRIAQLTSRIAVDTQRDSASMITIAALTIFFLPGTFVSAIFSMVFFSTQPTSNGTSSLTISSQWWIFLVVTIPLTIIVLGIWLFWARRRQQHIEREMALEELF